jgi:hypothetical protein
MRWSLLLWERCGGWGLSESIQLLGSEGMDPENTHNIFHDKSGPTNEVCR